MMEWDVSTGFLLRKSLLLQATFFPYPYPKKPLQPELDQLLFPYPPALTLHIPVQGGSWELDGIRFTGRVQGPEIQPDLVGDRFPVVRSVFSAPSSLVNLHSYRFRFQDREEAFAFARPLLEKLIKDWNRTLARNSGERAVRGFLRNRREEPEQAIVALLRLARVRMELTGWEVVLRYGREGKVWERGKGIRALVSEEEPALVPLLFG